MHESKSEHVFTLAADLLDDIELSKLPAEQLLLKVSRLARLTNNKEIRGFISLELNGYRSSSELCKEYMGLTGRWTDKEKGLGYRQNLAGIEADIAASKLQLGSMRVPDIHTSVSSANPRQYVNIGVPGSQVMPFINQYALLRTNVIVMSAIKSKVLGLLHRFVSDAYYERVFSGHAQSVFDRYKLLVDEKLAGRCSDVLEKLPSVYDRLAEGDEEAVSQALTTCRRIIDAFADSVFPATDETKEIGGNTLRLTQSHVQNRINVYVSVRTSSKSRQAKIRQSLANLYERVSAGVHADVPGDEAKALLLGVYMTLGEVIMLPEPADNVERLG